MTNQFKGEQYGEGTKEYQRANDFITNKNQELVARLGNSLLNEMSQQAQQERQSKCVLINRPLGDDAL